MSAQSLDTWGAWVRRAVCLVSLLTFLDDGGCAGGAAGPRIVRAAARDEAPTVRADAQYLYGPVHGRLQTPTGGNPGTTSHGRPTLAELGIDRGSQVDLGVKGGWGNHQFYGGYRIFRLSGDSTLDETLISQGHTFDAGTRVSSDVTLDWFRVGYRYRLPVDVSGDGAPDFSLLAGGGVAVWDFDYRLSQAGPEDVSRSYVLWTPQAALGAEVPLGNRLAVVADGLFSVPVAHQPLIFSGTVVARYRLLAHGRTEADVELGVSFDRIDYRDNQEVPNDVSIDAGPMVVAGVSVRF